ncbi:MAG: aldo/keto reductase [Bryobacterales bacterium]|nr:aldo/keto reductase [Bryobacteraceae bacterium]MDW8354532.1 aldo/keto reductase [Bryobacterales bacterium]
MTRRNFLLCAAAGMPGPLPAASLEWRNRQPGMAYRRLGRTGFMVSEVVMGGNRIAPDNYEHVLLALDMGLNYLDTAPAYGKGASELGFARVIQSRSRETVFLTTKVSLWDINRNRVYREIFESLPEPEQRKLRLRAQEEIERRKVTDPDYFGNYFEGQRAELDAAALANVMEKEYGRRIDREKNYKKLVLDSVEESLKRLGTDHLDILMCPHGASTPYEVLNYPEIFDAFEVLKKAGKVRYLGLSAHTDPAGILEAAIEAKVYSMAMVAYNIVNHRYVDRALEKARQADFGVIAMKVARPVYRGGDERAAEPGHAERIETAVPGPWKRPQKAYLWALQNPNLSGVISEMVNADMVRDNLPLAGRKLAA